MNGLRRTRTPKCTDSLPTWAPGPYEFVTGIYANPFASLMALFEILRRVQINIASSKTA